MPNRLSGSRAIWPAASTSSTVKSIGVSSGFSFSLGGGGVFGFGGGFGAGFFAAAFVSSSVFSSFGSFGGGRGPGVVLVAATERYTALRSLTPQADRSASGTAIE